MSLPLQRPKTKKKYSPWKISEVAIQKAFFGWLDLFTDVRDFTFMIPNGGKRTEAEAAHLKAQGLTAGVPDLFMAVPRNGYHGLFIELKTSTGRLADVQAQWIKKLNEQNYLAVVCYGLDDAMDVVRKYLGMEHA